MLLGIGQVIIVTNKVVVGLKLWENGNSSNQQMLTTLSLVFLFILNQTNMMLAVIVELEQM